jgi:hypothetical protein
VQCSAVWDDVENFSIKFNIKKTFAYCSNNQIAVAC